MSQSATDVTTRVELFYAFMIEREKIRLRRAQGLPQSEWTNDEIFKKYSFTNVKRHHDRTTRLLYDEFYKPFASRVSETHGPDWSKNQDIACTLLLNCAIFRYFGCIETARAVGWSEDWSRERHDKTATLSDLGELKFTPAYIVPTCGRKEPKYRVVCDIVDDIWKHARDVVSRSHSFQSQCDLLKERYGCGVFMAKEILLDYILTTGVKPDDWQMWTPIGPGGRGGASRIKYGVGKEVHPSRGEIHSPEALQVIREVYAQRDRLWPKDMTELELTDIQFQMCEFDKYSRVAEGKTPKRRFNPTTDYVTDETMTRKLA